MKFNTPEGGVIRIAVENPVPVDRLGMCFVTPVSFRPPKAGEYYLSGAIVHAYRAVNDFTTSYAVVRPTHKAKARKIQGWERGDEVSIDG